MANLYVVIRNPVNNIVRFSCNDLVVEMDYNKKAKSIPSNDVDLLRDLVEFSSEFFEILRSIPENRRFFYVDTHFYLPDEIEVMLRDISPMR